MDLYDAAFKGAILGEDGDCLASETAEWVADAAEVTWDVEVGSTDGVWVEVGRIEWEIVWVCVWCVVW